MFRLVRSHLTSDQMAEIARRAAADSPFPLGQYPDAHRIYCIQRSRCSATKVSSLRWG